MHTALDALAREVRQALRRLRRKPVFSVSVVVILALGLSASTAVFGYINNFGQPFPGADGRGLQQVHLALEDDPYRDLSYPDYLDLASAATGAVSPVAGHASGFAASVRLETLAEVAFGQAVTGGYFDLLGIGLARGRGIGQEDDVAAAEPVTVISHAYWLRRYDGADSALGSTILLNNEPYTIVGVVAPDFLGSTSGRRPDFYLPFEQYKRVYWARSDRATDREASAISAFVRFSGSHEAGRSVLAALASSLDREAPLATGARRLNASPATWIPPSTRTAELPTARLWLAAAVGLLLLACANAANLVLASSTTRGQEMGIRAAIGATRGRLIRQSLVESTLLGVLAGAVALALAGPASRRIGSYFAQPSVWGTSAPRVVDLDWTVFLFALLVSVATGALAGLVPALRQSRSSLARSMAGGSDRLGRGARFGGSDLLVASQVSLSVALLVAAGLVARTLLAAQAVDVGFDTERTVASYISTSSIGTPPEERHRFYRELAERLEALSWVRAATISDYAPLSPHSGIAVRPEASDEAFTLPHAKVAAGYFEALEIPIVEGREFTPLDTLGTEPVAVVSRTLAARVFGDSDPVGGRLWLPGSEEEPDRPLLVVGVAEDARLETVLGGPEAVLYLPHAQYYSAPGNGLVVSTGVDPGAAVPMLEEALRSIDPRIAIVNVLPSRDLVDGYLYTQRMNAELFGLVALLGALLAGVGIFAIVSLRVGQRARELGIRVALGASGANLVRLVTSRVVAATGIGLGVGLLASLPVSRLLATQLYGVGPTDPMSWAVGAGVVLLVVAAATYGPTRRATRLDPMEALRPDST